MKEMQQKAINLIRKLSVYSLHPVYYKFRMTEDEQKIFNKYIKKSKYYLEFGSGGSTLRALQKSKAIIYSVESNEDWINHLSKFLIIRRAQQKRLFFHLADIGETQRWGYPISGDSKKLFPNFSKSIFSIIDANKIDTTLIDGRFRVACVLSLILNVKSNSDVIILIHDFWNREKYQIVLKYLTEIDRADTLGVFKLKDTISLSAVKEDYETFKYIPD